MKRRKLILSVVLLFITLVGFGVLGNYKRDTKDNNPKGTPQGYELERLGAGNQIAPGTPTGLSVQRNTVNSVMLFWNPAYNNIAIKGYAVLRNNVPIGYTEKRVFKDANIKVGETYSYKVTAYTPTNVYSGYSNTESIYITKSPGLVYWAKANQYTGHIKGTDVSKYLPVLEWKRIKNDGIRYVYVRAAGSTVDNPYIIDPMASKHTVGIKSAGLPVGFYYIPQWSAKRYSINGAKMAAKRYADHINTLMIKAGSNGYGDLLPILDIEPVKHQLNVGLTPKQIVDWARIFCDYFKNYTGRTVMIYTNRSFWEEWGVTPEINTVKNLPLWNAEYYEFNNYLYSSDDTPRSFGGWKGWNIWQHSQSAVIGGYTRMDASWCRSLDLIMRPTIPVNLSGYNSSAKTVRLAWNRNKEIDIKGYNIYKDGALFKTTTDNNITISGLKVGKTYNFKVQAVDIYNDVSSTVPKSIYVWR